MASIWGELKRRNVVKVAVAYAIVGWILVEVSATVLPIFEAPDWIVQVFTFFVILGFPLALILSWAYELTPEGIKLERNVAAGESITQVTGRKLDFAIIGLLLVAVGFLVFNYVLVDSDREAVVQETISPTIEPAAESPVPEAVEEQRTVLPNSVAVLPFRNDSPDPNNAYYASGIHEEILNQLVKLSALNVIARTSVEQYKDTEKSIPEIARELNVDTVLEGSVRFDAGRIRITTQLNDGVTGLHIWSETYTRDFDDIFAIESDVAMNVANAVGAEFSLEEQASIEKIPTDSPAAYALYLRSFTGPYVSILEALDRAIALDPDFAVAYARRAFINAWTLVGVASNPVTRQEQEQLVRDSADRALALDPTLGLAYAALAGLHSANWRGAEAEREFALAYQLSPNDSSVVGLYARFKRYRGEYDESIRLNQRVMELDPNGGDGGGGQYQLGLTYRFAKNHDAAVEEIEEVLARNPAFLSAHVNLALVEAVRGNSAVAVRHLQIAEELEPNTFRLSQMALAYAQAGRPEDAQRHFAEFERRANEGSIDDAHWTRAYLAVGDYQQALQRLENAVANRLTSDVTTLTEIAANPWSDPELDKPEFRELLDRLWDE